MRRVAIACLPFAIACASAQAPVSEPASGAPSASVSAQAPEPAASSAAAPAPPVVPTGGSVLVGDINAPKGFNPKPVIDAFASDIVHCYNEARAITPDLRGKVTLRIQVNEAGAVLSVDADPGGHANDPGLVSCINELMKARAHFPKPGGTATVLAPLVFRP